MYLRRVELYGFKSFADRTELELSPGITAIVGPNGSGKSNIGDAIRWVLGEQSARILRGARMEDVIFAGSSARKPLGFAETTLVVDNGQGELPVDFDEVAITRRVYRSGESEFYICGAPCRLKDISALFMNTGVGREGYALLEQGRIDSILAAGSDERRAFFEEAAGIQKYKARKAESQRRLVLIDAATARLGDVVGELSRQIEPLAAKADAARRLAEFGRELAALEVGLALSDLDTLEERRAELARHIYELEGKIEETLRLRESLASTIARNREELVTVGDECDRLQAQVAECAAKTEKAEGKAAVGRERLAAQASHARDLTDAVTKNRGRQATIAAELGAKRARLAEIESELEQARAGLAVRQLEDRDLQEQWRLDRALEDKLKVDIIQTLSEMAEVKNDLAKLALEDGSDARRAEGLRKDIEASLADAAETEASIAEDERRRHESAARLTVVEGKTRELGRSIEEAHRRLKDLLAGYESLASEAREKAHELGAYERLASQGELYPQGARAVLAAARKGALEGILGAIGDAIRVPHGLDRAIEEALGQAVSDIIVVKDAHAKAAVRHLKQGNLGRATFLPLDLVRPGTLRREERAALASDGVLGVASDLVSCDPGLEKALAHLLGRTVIVRDLDVAVSVSRATATRLKVVTVDGEIVFPGGAISGGSARARSQEGVLSLRRRLESMRQDLAKLEDSRGRAQAAIESARDEIAMIERELAGTRSEAQALELEAARIAAAQAQARRELERMGSRIQVLRDELDTGTVAQGDRGARRQELERRNTQLGSVSRELGETQARIVARSSEIAQAREGLARAITAAEVTIAQLAQEAAGLREQVPSLNAQANDLALDIDAKEAELARAVSASGCARAAIAQAQAELDALSAERAEADQSLARARAERKELGRRVAQAESKLRLCQGDAEDLQKTRASCSIEEAALAEKAGGISEELARAHQITLDEARRRAPSSLSREEARGRATFLRSEIEALGPVDPGVLAVYESLGSRHRELAAGLDDISRARRVLQEAADEADREAERRFRETLHEVRREFGRTFARLFGGGRADLVMVGGNESVPPGVEIVAEPPGKRLQSLTLLSAGEKALAAAALVFAILDVRPSPFCVLDEVDAALDEANVARFVELLREAAARSQFVVVTHRKGTMEAADVLYGVTMEESGVSKLISVNLADVGYRERETA